MALLRRPVSLHTVAWIALLAFLCVAWTQRARFNTPGPGSEAPDFELPSLEGRSISLSDYENKVVLLNLWATWCAPCLQEMPSMERLYQRFKAEGFEILAVNIDAPHGERDAHGNPGGDIAGFVEKLGLTFPILLDPDREVERKYRTFGVPESFLIGRDGIIHRRIPGATVWEMDQHVELVRRLLGEGG